MLKVVSTSEEGLVSRVVAPNQQFALAQPPAHTCQHAKVH